MKNTKASSNFVTVLASAHSGESEKQFLQTALAFSLEKEDGKPSAPEWVQIFPEGPELATNDGRTFKMSDAKAFVDRHNAAGQPIMVDYDHLSAFDPDESGPQEAAGWIEELEIRDGQVWARVAWTVRAAAKIADREYRFVSPEFLAHKKTNEIITLDALALVNRPAFQMTALARSQKTKIGEPPMFNAIAKALGLDETADEATILTAIEKSNADHATELAAAKAPSTKDFMPRADYDAVLARATAAEAKVDEAADEARKGEVETMITAAVKAGKITPGSKDHYVNLAMLSEEGFKEIKELCSTLNVVVTNTDLDAKVTATGGLPDEDKEMAASLGVSEEDFAKQLAADKR